ncbi:hypothetical protein [Kordiimonas sp. SCSIO 12610]|uniref:hypothetical protein n=1 Tax=Kordiimonas sp. SCSIO 12610 TaxID=2829597 RepID=UPI00210E583F|nr:hypothetical protein [Kordiimonas sp. SCSIO 12610]UTW53967.1 hypothetical protein KFF44_08945 [Kordiimonas sp. SCSIO 12610]
MVMPVGSGSAGAFNQIGSQSYFYRGNQVEDVVIFDPVTNANGILINTLDFSSVGPSLIRQTESDYENGILFCGTPGGTLGGADGGFKVSRQNIFIPPGHGLIGRANSNNWNVSITYEEL